MRPIFENWFPELLVAADESQARQCLLSPGGGGGGGGGGAWAPNAPAT